MGLTININIYLFISLFKYTFLIVFHKKKNYYYYFNSVLTLRYCQLWEILFIN